MWDYERRAAPRHVGCRPGLAMCSIKSASKWKLWDVQPRYHTSGYWASEELQTFLVTTSGLCVGPPGELSLTPKENDIIFTSFTMEA